MAKDLPPLEGSSFTHRQVRILKISIAVMTALLILGILALVYGMARQASRMGTAEKASGVLAHAHYSKTVDLGEGNLEGVTTTHGMLILHWKNQAGDTILTIDPKDGNELGRIQVPRH